LHAETALGTGRMTSTFECSKKWGDYHGGHQITDTSVSSIQASSIWATTPAQTQPTKINIESVQISSRCRLINPKSATGSYPFSENISAPRRCSFRFAMA
ncbi:hypothetical protein, partial [Aeromonas sp. QDB07]|uniref:hypothetical protein n=1 Tax=Aeromonas sp. QDB07 TaxID=2989838 RepID=UPI0022E53671